MKHLALLCLSATTLAAAPLTTLERERLLEHFQMTESWLVSELAGLSDTQLNWRAAEGKWSIAEIVAHLAIAEPQYWDQVKQSMAKPVEEGFKPKATDAGILWYGIDRTRRNKTAEARTPHGEYKSAAEALAPFRKLRAEMISFVKSTPDDLRGRRFLTSEMDVYQWVLMITSHSQRHILQVREAKALSGFPAR
ncbi:MAG TPA: DinB family protein [Bryobacteraceae bacterium]|jgi:DinB family protein|nr:DinB family protein [Bryobacteraceae bacterium]